jgi:hypothetical protein
MAALCRGRRRANAGEKTRGEKTTLPVSPLLALSSLPSLDPFPAFVVFHALHTTHHRQGTDFKGPSFKLVLVGDGGTGAFARAALREREKSKGRRKGGQETRAAALLPLLSKTKRRRLAVGCLGRPCCRDRGCCGRKDGLGPRGRPNGGLLLGEESNKRAVRARVGGGAVARDDGSPLNTPSPDLPPKTPRRTTTTQQARRPSSSATSRASSRRSTSVSWPVFPARVPAAPPRPSCLDDRAARPRPPVRNRRQQLETNAPPPSSSQPTHSRHHQPKPKPTTKTNNTTKHTK